MLKSVQIKLKKMLFKKKQWYFNFNNRANHNEEQKIQFMIYGLIYVCSVLKNKEKIIIY